LAQSQQPRQQFTGKERDPETNMDYFLARYYGSLYGRFTSPDEFTGGPDELYDFADTASDNPTFYADLTDPQSLNKYQYCYNNPLTTVDPDGHKGWRERLSEAASAVADFGDGVIRGAAASLSFGTAPGSGPSSNDSLINRAGQVLGTAIVGGVGTSSATAGGAAIVGTGGAAALTVAPVVAVVGGATMAVGAAKNAVAIATTPIKSVTNNQQSSGGSQQNNGGNSGDWKPKPGDSQSKSPRAAIREAKRQSGIPTSQTHTTHRTVRDKQLPGKTVKEYDFNIPTRGGGRGTATIQHHRHGHPKGNVPRHFNDVKGGHHVY
jgi:RHS repeat-associated protein